MIRGFYALAVALVAALLVTLASTPLPVPRPVEVSPQPAERELTFEERWEPVRQLPPMIQMNELEPRTIPVKTISIRAEPAVYVEPAEQVATAEPMPKPRPAIRPKIVFRPRDICARHGMHKQITRGGKSWRCRR